jgi:dUTP pyrophosphatase
VKVKIKKLNQEATIPEYATTGDAGLDLTAISKTKPAQFTDGSIVYGTGLAIEIPEGYVGLLFPRSSISRYGLMLTNSVGVIDSSFRGEIQLKFKPVGNYSPLEYGVGERVAQLIILPYPQIELVEAQELSDSERGSGSYGSTGQ